MQLGHHLICTTHLTKILFPFLQLLTKADKTDLISQFWYPEGVSMIKIIPKICKLWGATRNELKKTLHYFNLFGVCYANLSSTRHPQIGWNNIRTGKGSFVWLPYIPILTWPQCNFSETSYGFTSMTGFCLWQGLPQSGSLFSMAY